MRNTETKEMANPSFRRVFRVWSLSSPQGFSGTQGSTSLLFHRHRSLKESVSQKELKGDTGSVVRSRERTILIDLNLGLRLSCSFNIPKPTWPAGSLASYPSLTKADLASRLSGICIHPSVPVTGSSLSVYPAPCLKILQPRVGLPFP